MANGSSERGDTRVRYRDQREALDEKCGWLRVSNAILFGMPWVSDGALRTYLRIRGMDWGRLGELWWSKRRLALLCDLPLRTFQDHVAELIHYGLLGREYQEGDETSTLFIEPIPEVAYRLAIYKRDIVNARHRGIWPDHGSGGFPRSLQEWAMRHDEELFAQLTRYSMLYNRWRDRKRRATGA